MCTPAAFKHGTIHNTTLQCMHLNRNQTIFRSTLYWNLAISTDKYNILLWVILIDSFLTQHYFQEIADECNPSAGNRMQ